MRRGLAAAAVVAGLGLAFAGPAWAVFPGENGRIMYAAGEGAGYAVHTILPSGHGDRVLEGNFAPGVWSPNGHRIALTGANPVTGAPDIYTMRTDQTDLRRLTFNGQSASPQYSPDGRRIAFSQPMGLTIMRSDGSDKRVISAPKNVTWTPNNQLAFHKAGGLWEMNPNGTHKHQLVSLGRGGGSGPYYSPNGRRFLFVRSSLDGYTWQVKVADADGSNVRAAGCPRFFGRFQPTTYSPDGEWVLGSRPEGDPRSPYAYTIARLRLDTCRWRRVVGPVHFGTDWQALPDASIER